MVPWEGEAVPLIAFRGEKFEVFVDRTHTAFKAFQVKPEFMVAAEIADYIYELNRRLATNEVVHSLSNLAWQVLERRWSDDLEDSAEKVSEAVNGFFDMIRARLSTILGERREDVYRDLTEEQQRSLVDNLINRRQDPARLGEMRTSGEFLKYIDNDTVVSIIRKDPGIFFDGKFWKRSFNEGLDLPETIVREYQLRIKTPYLNSLEDIAAFLRYESPELLLVQRARMSLEFLTQDVA
jgi:hypothetical protein